MKLYKLWALGLALMVMFAGCGAEESSSSPSASSGASASTVSQSEEYNTEMFTDRDFEIGYDEEQSALIQLDGDSAQCDSDAVSISDSTVTITDEGTYILTGTLDDGMVIIEAQDTDKLHLVLDGVTIHNDTSAALYIREADKVFVTTTQDSENTLSNGGEYVAIDDNNIDGVIFSKGDLTLNGAGTLVINASAGHGVVSKDDLVITSGTYDITSANHGLSGKDSVRIAGGAFTITSGKDGVQAENADDTTLGFLYIADGTFDINAQGDGLSAGNYLQAEGGSYTLLTGGGSANATSQSNDFFGAAASTEDTVSMKGIKATGDLLISGGTFSIDSADDSLHSNANVTVSGGDFEIATGDDGVHADANVTISAGTLLITESYEGIEGQSIDITGGDIDLTSSDDGLNAAGGNDESGFASFGEGGHHGADAFAADENAYIHIAGGTLRIDASGDGIDSNGSLTVSGGETYLSGPDNGGNGALDYASDAEITGGIFVAAGASQMAQNFSSTSTQGVMMVTVSSQQAGSAITLTDQNGQELISWTADKAFDSVILSCSEILEGETYTLSVGGTETQVTMDSLVYGSGGMGGMGGMPGGGMGGGNMGTPPDGMGGGPGGGGAAPTGTP